MKQILAFIFLATTLFCQAQSKEKFNLGFENQQEEASLSEGWFKWGAYDLTIDEDANTGTKSGKITSNGNGEFGSIAYKIPARYKGKSIKLEAYMKINNIVDGFAGLLLRIDGNGSSLAFDNMESQNIAGTKDWEKYSITLDYPEEEAENIFIAGIISGKGEAWFDDFVLTIDDESIQTLKEVVKPIPKAQLDTEFDNGSLIDLLNLSDEDVDKLELLGRVWGFLKYHHPEIAKGNYNWDYELFRFLPKYIESKGKNDEDKLLVQWIESLGQIEECLKCKPTDVNAFLRPDLSWIDKEEKVLKDKLMSVYENRSQGRQYYIGPASGVGNPEFKNENDYSSMYYPDVGFRLLTVYKYWNMINYFFPYKHLMDKDWNTTLSEYIPLFLNAKNELEYEMTAIQMIGDIQDTHANLWGGADKLNEWKGLNYPPVHLRFIENKLVVVDYYNSELKVKAGLEIGDVIAKVNGLSIENILKDKSKYYPASNLPTRGRDISTDILRSNSTEIEIEVISGESKMRTHSLQLYPKDSLDTYRWYKNNKDKSYKMLDNNIGYVTLQSVQEEDIAKIKEEFKDTKGIIIDIRNYPSTFVPFSLGSYFVSSSTPFVKFTTANFNNPGEFNYTENLEIPKPEETYKGKLVVLLNELSQSQAEYTAMAFKAGDDTTIIGSTTAGVDGNVSRILLPGGFRTMISGIGIYYPDGGETQRIGIVPDIEVQPTIKGIIAGKDEVLEKAIEFLLKK